MQSSFPHEIFYDLARYLTLRDYINLRKTCKHMHKLNPVPVLFFEQYKESTEYYGPRVGGTLRMQLSASSICEESFIFLATHGHDAEFTRIYKTYKPLISYAAQVEAFRIIVTLNHPWNMLGVLTEGGQFHTFKD
jgi:hypothetical protein